MTPQSLGFNADSVCCAFIMHQYSTIGNIIGMKILSLKYTVTGASRISYCTCSTMTYSPFRNCNLSPAQSGIVSGPSLLRYPERMCRRHSHCSALCTPKSMIFFSRGAAPRSGAAPRLSILFPLALFMSSRLGRALYPPSEGDVSSTAAVLCMAAASLSMSSLSNFGVRSKRKSPFCSCSTS